LKLQEDLDYNDWIEIYANLSDWEMDLDKHSDVGLEQTLREQIRECNIEFSRFIEKNYLNWIHSRKRPVLSADVIKQFVIPELIEGKKVFFIIFDCLRNDQWLALEPFFYEFYDIYKEYHFSILPTATPYARNSLFSGLFPFEIEKEFPDIWQKGLEDESSRNRYERLFLEKLLSNKKV
jgi:hypothetical protein